MFTIHCTAVFSVYSTHFCVLCTTEHHLQLVMNCSVQHKTHVFSWFQAQVWQTKLQTLHSAEDFSTNVQCSLFECSPRGQERAQQAQHMSTGHREEAALHTIHTQHKTGRLRPHRKCKQQSKDKYNRKEKHPIKETILSNRG